MENKSKVAVVYKSKYGSTKKYAAWIAIKLDADLYELRDITGTDLLGYETIVYGAPLCAGKIKSFNFILKNFEKIKDKNIIIFTVGLQEDNEENRNKIMEANFNEEFSNKAKLFYLRGDFSYSDLTLIDKIMISGLKKSLEKKNEDELDEVGKILIKSLKSPIVYTDKKLVNPIVEYLAQYI